VVTATPELRSIAGNTVALVEDGLLPLSGGEDAEFFTIGEESYLVAAGLRSGRGPYRYNIDQLLYMDQRLRDADPKVRRLRGEAVAFFPCWSSSFLALAQGVALDHIEANKSTDFANLCMERPAIRRFSNS